VFFRKAPYPAMLSGTEIKRASSSYVYTIYYMVYMVLLYEYYLADEKLIEFIFYDNWTLRIIFIN
jgi:hypothetical protein